MKKAVDDRIGGGVHVNHVLRHCQQRVVALLREKKSGMTSFTGTKVDKL